MWNEAITLDPDTIADLDELIRPAVILLNKYGFKTFESCQGGEGHCYGDPTVRFEGTEFDLIRAYELCEIHGMNPKAAKRVYWKQDVYFDTDKWEVIGETWHPPFNELEFVIHRETGTIYRPRVDKSAQSLALLA